MKIENAKLHRTILQLEAVTKNQQIQLEEEVFLGLW